MFEKKDKRRLWELIDMFLSGRIKASVFCDEFYYAYDLEIDPNSLSPLENSIFSHLGIVASRFSESLVDIEKYPGVYFDEDQLKKSVIDAKENYLILAQYK